MLKFTKGTVDLSGENYSACSQVFLIFEQLIKHLEECESSKKYEFLKDTIKSMINKLNEYWPLIRDNALICMILDPCFKIDFFSCKKDKTNGVKLIEKLFQQYSELCSDNINSCEPLAQTNGK